jgi:transposase-like protein
MLSMWRHYVQRVANREKRMRESKRITKPKQANKCPHCKSIKIKLQMEMHDEGYLNRWYCCYDCNSTWRIKYKPIEIKDLVRDDEK